MASAMSLDVAYAMNIGKAKVASTSIVRMIAMDVGNAFKENAFAINISMERLASSTVAQGASSQDLVLHLTCALAMESVKKGIDVFAVLVGKDQSVLKILVLIIAVVMVLASLGSALARKVGSTTIAVLIRAPNTAATMVNALQENVIALRVGWAWLAI